MKAIKCRKTILVLPKTNEEKLICEQYGNPAKGGWWSMLPKHVTPKGNIRKSINGPLDKTMRQKILKQRGKANAG